MGGDSLYGEGWPFWVGLAFMGGGSLYGPGRGILYRQGRPLLSGDGLYGQRAAFGLDGNFRVRISHAPRLTTGLILWPFSWNMANHLAKVSGRYLLRPRLYRGTKKLTFLSLYKCIRMYKE